MSELYPIFMKLEGKTVLIAGAGDLGRQKLSTLEATGADVIIADPDLGDEFPAWSGAGKLTLLLQAYSPELLHGVFLVFAATGDSEVNRRIVSDAKAKGILVNAVDDPPHCEFYTPAVLRRGALTVAISSAGGFPGLTAALRQTLERWLPEEDDELIESLFQIRRRLLEIDPDGSRRRKALMSLANSFTEQYLAPLDAKSIYSGSESASPGSDTR